MKRWICCVAASATLAGIAAVVSPYNQTLASAAGLGGSVRTWGFNGHGALGNGTLTDSPNPLRVLSGAASVSSSADANQSLALMPDGSVFAWGDNSHGQLGIGTVGGGAAACNYGCIPTPVKVLKLGPPTTLSPPDRTPAIAIATGAAHSLAVTAAGGAVLTWGLNFRGQLGDGTTNDHADPKGVCDPNPAVRCNGQFKGVAAVAAGNEWSLALRATGEIFAWGNNDGGQLGNGSTLSAAVPVQVQGVPFSSAIAAGDDHGLALGRDGTVYAWGGNASGQLGNGTLTASTIARQVIGLTNVVGIAGGNGFSLALKSDGSVWAWGAQSAGQLGYGVPFTESIFQCGCRATPTQVTGISSAVAVAAGRDQGLARLADGTVMVWGQNLSGQTGPTSQFQGNPCVCNPTPVPMRALAGVGSIAAGSGYSLAVMATGTSHLWVDVMGRSTTSPGRLETYTVVYGNSGDVATFDGILLIKLPTSLSYRLRVPLPSGTGIDWSHVPLGAPDAGQTVIPVWINSLPGNSMSTIALMLSAGTTGPYAVTAELWQPADSDFTNAGNPALAEESSLFGTILDSYVSAQAAGDIQLSQDSVVFGGNLAAWMQTNISRIASIPYCAANTLAASVALGSPVSSLVSSDLCNAVPASIDAQLGGLEPDDTQSALSASQTASSSAINLAGNGPPVCPPGEVATHNDQQVQVSCEKLFASAPFHGADWQNACFTDYFGQKRINPVTHLKQTHHGIDIVDRPQIASMPLYAEIDGTVFRARKDNVNGSGYMVIIDNGLGLRVGHAHMTKDLRVKEGDHVNAGDLIGFSDTTGSAKGPHLHLTVKVNGTPVDPSELIPDRPDGSTLPPCGGQAPQPKEVIPNGVLNFQVVNSQDPNVKSGASGSGLAHYVTGAPLPYMISFENQPSATAPAQQIVITDQLDPNKVDIGTVELGPIVFGSNVVQPDPNVGDSSTVVDLRPTVNLEVRVNAKVDVVTGLISWRLSSIDPSTGLPPIDLSQGFLPPDVTPPQGEGSVMLTVSPSAGMTSGTTITNSASVTFDQNAPIRTNAWTNVFDDVPPASAVNRLPITQSSQDFAVSWSGNDDVSGVEGYNIFVSVDRTLWTPFLTDSAATSTMFFGQRGHTYSFISQAIDNAGNVEPFHSTPDTTTSVSSARPTSLRYTGATTADFHDPATVSASLLDTSLAPGTPVSGQVIDFNLNGSESCSATTDSTGQASCSVTPREQVASYSLAASFAGSAQYQPSSTSIPFQVTPEEVVLSNTGSSQLEDGQAATLEAMLSEDGSVAIVGRTLTLNIGAGALSQSCVATTDIDGIASCVIRLVDQPLGPGTISIRFDGDGYYKLSTSSVTDLVFALVSAGSFVIGDKNANVDSAVTFWGGQWAKANSLSSGDVPPSFIGFADTAPLPPSCAGNWSASPGNSSNPPLSVPSYMAVIVSSAIAKHGSRITGDISHVVIVRTDQGYQPDPGHPATGTVVAMLC